MRYFKLLKKALKRRPESDIKIGLRLRARNSKLRIEAKCQGQSGGLGGKVRYENLEVKIDIESEGFGLDIGV